MDSLQGLDLMRQAVCLLHLHRPTLALSWQVPEKSSMMQHEHHSQCEDSGVHPVRAAPG